MLLGRCGELDIGDCMAAARLLIQRGIAREGEGAQFVAGGSHGGFLTAHGGLFFMFCELTKFES